MRHRGSGTGGKIVSSGNSSRSIPLAVENLLLPPKDLCAVLRNIHALVGPVGHGQDTPEHLQEAGVGTGGGGGTTTLGSLRRSDIWRRRDVASD
jgi:hypothetical protein